MNWTIILQSFIAAVISSAVVSSIVTFYLEDRRDLKKRKIAAYTDFLEQYRKIFPLGELDMKGKKRHIPIEELIKWRNSKMPEVIQLESRFHMVLILGGRMVRRFADIIHVNLNRALVSIDREQYLLAVDCLTAARAAYTPLISVMANEIQGKTIYEPNYVKGFDPEVLDSPQHFFGFDHRVGHLRPLSIRGRVPQLSFPQVVRCFHLEHRLLGWPMP
jgi:hypothetical protein